MTWYSVFREDGGPTLYGPWKTSVTADVLEAGLLYALGILAFSLVVILPGIRGKEKLFFVAKAAFCLLITACILLCNFGQEWEVAELHTKTQYRAGLAYEIEAEIGVKIGLRSVNITLKGDPEVHEFGQLNETINYNERFSWNDEGWVQGRGGFGPFAGLVNREFREAQRKGLPYPILWIAEYFTLDGEGIRWGRHYRQAGYYTHILVWLAFPMWLVSMILLKMVLTYGAYFSSATGCILLLANIIYACIRNPLQLEVPFEDGRLTFHWGWCFWLNLFNGFLCLLIGLVVWVMELRFKEAIDTFFGRDAILDIEEYYTTPEELAKTGIKYKATRKEARGQPERAINGKDQNRQSGSYDNNTLDRQGQYVRAFRPRHTWNKLLSVKHVVGRRTLVATDALQPSAYQNEAFNPDEMDSSPEVAEEAIPSNDVHDDIDTNGTGKRLSYA